MPIMESLPRFMTKAPRRWSTGYKRMDWEALKTSTLTWYRKTSKGLILFIILSLSLILFFLTPGIDLPTSIKGSSHGSGAKSSHKNIEDEIVVTDLVAAQSDVAKLSSSTSARATKTTASTEHEPTESSSPLDFENIQWDEILGGVDPDEELKKSDSKKSGSSKSKEDKSKEDKSKSDKSNDEQKDTKPSEPKKDVARRFVLVIPADKGGHDLCKTIITALALGYPSPVIINWNVDYKSVTGYNGGENLPKIPGFLKYLDSVMHDDADSSEKLKDDDLVLLVDAYDVWFQLPAEVLLRRYHKINEEANERLKKSWTSNNPMPWKQTVIAGSGKNCHPQPSSGSDTHCEALPDSPLREDLYGPYTEKDDDKTHDHRPKYINGGLYMGPARDLRRLFRRATEKMYKGLNEGTHLFSEQGIPGEVLGEQEVYRNWRRENPDITIGNATVHMERDFEYHFGLDYNQTLSVQTYWTDTDDGKYDGDFIHLNDQDDIDKKSKDLGIKPVRLKGIPEDLKEAENPLKEIIKDKEPDWGDMNLYADFFTESVPVIVHHNGFKERRHSMWNKPWFHRRLRPLLKPRLKKTDLEPMLGTVETDDSTITYWAPHAEASDRNPRMMGKSAKARLARMEFNDICKWQDEDLEDNGEHWWDEVFRDLDGSLEF